MSHFITDEQTALRDAAQVFARREIESIATQIDRDEYTPPELTAKLAGQGFFGLLIPEEYGGAGADLTSCCLVLEELAKASPAFAGLVSVEMILCPQAILTAGTEEQKKRLLPKSATGERLMAFSQTEPSGAGNVEAHLTKLTPDGSNFRLNGGKLFCTQGEAKTYLVTCRTQLDGVRGYGCAIVEREAEGFSVAPYEHKLGWRGTNTGPINFTNVLVTEENILGDLLTSVQDFFLPVNQPSYLGHAATSVGCAVGMFEKTLSYVKERQLYGEPMYRLSPIIDRIGMAWSKIEAMRALLYTSTRLFDQGSRDLNGSICKAWICETAFEICNSLLQLWGGSGIMDSTGINRYFRDSRAKLIAEGSTEMHTDLIAKLVLGLPLTLG
jgi:alkylation response protein AidB-like acyl-CoA dehydrogenase